ncbi:MAG: Sporulation kinase, partial [Planctomycetota bacterium]
MLALIVTRGPDRGRSFTLPEREPQLVGRSSEALHLTDSTVSRRHAELTPDDGRWTLRDLGSRHGTRVNGVRIAGAVEVRAGDRIAVGDTELLAIREGEGSPVALDERAENAAVNAPIAAISGAAANADGDRVAARLVSLAAEPTDADTFLAEAAKVIAAELARAGVADGEVVPLRAIDAGLEQFVSPTHGKTHNPTHAARNPPAPPHAPLALVRAAIDGGEILAGTVEQASVVVAPFGAIGRSRGAFLLRRSDRRAPAADVVAILARAAEVATLALAARGERDEG